MHHHHPDICCLGGRNCDWDEKILRVIFVYISLVAKDVKPLKTSVVYLCFFGFHLLTSGSIALFNFYSSLYILDINPAWSITAKGSLTFILFVAYFLCRSFLMSWNSTCQFLGLFLVLWNSIQKFVANVGPEGFSQCSFSSPSLSCFKWELIC